MQEIKANLYPCKHCNETGTCSSGENGSSCSACVKYHELKGKQQYFGLACGTCNGVGQAEPTTERINKRVKPILSMVIVFLLLVFSMLLALTNNKYFPEFIVFAGTIIGSVTTFYFSNSKNT